MRRHWLRLLKTGLVIGLVLLGVQAVVAARSPTVPELGAYKPEAQVMITKTVVPTSTVNYGDSLTYTLSILAPLGTTFRLYDPLSGTTFLDFVQRPEGITHTASIPGEARYLGGLITGTLTVTPSHAVSVSFVVQVVVPATAGWSMDVTNRACVYPPGETYNVCVWSNQVVNAAVHRVILYLPTVIKDYVPNYPPYVPSNPTPADGASDQIRDVDLRWRGGDPNGDAVTYEVSFSSGTPLLPLEACRGITVPFCDLDVLEAHRQYSWQVVAEDEHGAAVSGPTWWFTTGNHCSIHLAVNTPQVTDLTVTVSGTVTTPCSAIARLNWQWGDGMSDDQTFPASHIYAISGTYPISVTAYNDVGDTEVAYTTAYVGLDTGEVVLVPAGEFQMGCDSSNPSEICTSDEQPLHTVYLDAYAIHKHEVTNAQYKACVDAGGCSPPERYGSRTRVRYYDDPRYANYPVVHVSWYDANDYCMWAGKRLPTEAEWEKAARSSSDTRMYPWGNGEPGCSRLNYQHYNGSSSEYCVGDTTPVGSYPTGASPYGAMDMAGNVLEWVSDWYDPSYYSSSPYESPPGPASGTFRVLRGGSWIDNWGSVRVANRYSFIIAYGSSYYLGFRCVSSDVPGY